MRSRKRMALWGGAVALYLAAAVYLAIKPSAGASAQSSGAPDSTTVTNGASGVSGSVSLARIAAPSGSRTPQSPAQASASAGTRSRSFENDRSRSSTVVSANQSGESNSSAGGRSTTTSAGGRTASNVGNGSGGAGGSNTGSSQSTGVVSTTSTAARNKVASIGSFEPLEFTGSS